MSASERILKKNRLIFGEVMGKIIVSFIVTLGTLSFFITSTHLGIWACGSTWRRHTGKRGSSARHQRITQPTSWPHLASPTWLSTEQLARPATKRFHPSDWRALEACCRPWTWWCNDATALAGYANMVSLLEAPVSHANWRRCRLGRDRLVWVRGTVCWREVHIGAIWRIRL